MQTSDKGLRLTAYRDVAGIWTIGYGHTAAAGNPKPVAGMAITEAQADAILSGDLHSFEIGVLAAIKRPMEQGQFDAMVSLAFNIGIGAFRSSSVVRWFNRGDPIAAANAFRLWDRAGGKVQSGLARRREAERSQFLSAGCVPSASIVETTRKVDNPHSLPQRVTARLELALAAVRF
jgi:lysozyme